MMVNNRYRKPHRYKKRKPIFRKRFLALGILAIIIVGGVFYGLFLWKVFWVEKIIVSGEEKTTKEEIEFLIGKRLENRVLSFVTKSIFAVDAGQIKTDILNAFPQIAAAEVKKSFFDAISVLVIERTTVALWCEQDSCFLLDNEGVIFEEAYPEPGLIIIERGTSSPDLFLGKTVIAKDELAQILKIESKLAEIKIAIKKTMVVSDERLDVKTGEGWDIRFNLKGDLDWQLKELSLVLEKQISPEKRRGLEYIDLRFSRVYYK